MAQIRNAGEETVATYNDNGMGRASYIVALSAALLAFSPVKDSFGAFRIDVFSYQISIYSLALVWLLLLIFSGYAYGVSSIRYLYPKIMALEWTKYIELFSDSLYVLAILFPILVLATTFLSLLVTQTNLPHLELIQNTASLVGATLTLIGSFMAAYASYKNKERIVIENINDQIGSFLFESTSSNPEDPKITLLRVYQRLISELRIGLTHRIGAQSRRLPDFEIVAMSRQKGLLRDDDMSSIEDLRQIRNKVAHNIDSEQIANSNVDSLLRKVSPIVLRISRNNVAYLVSS